MSIIIVLFVSLLVFQFFALKAYYTQEAEIDVATSAELVERYSVELKDVVREFIPVLKDAVDENDPAILDFVLKNRYRSPKFSAIARALISLRFNYEEPLDRK